MAISHEDLSENLRRIVLSGRLDFHGVEEIVEQMAALLSSAGLNVVVDLTAATLICSMGIRALILNAKSIQQRGGRMALVVDDTTTVSATLKSVGIDTLLPVFMNISDAKNALQG
jgi:anti-sigma B factor antagonist